ncbi:hypothetical protein O181_121203 [Austropuccinia psidii MF-1]|uniref:Reverse transcriptase Ty1/copia-type domain-containing protein n=1 Tax=Austropuccinia psidii MF-1 TaxID=1389203 RepID=A0A9Q3KH41_9BASI|nr:hypothetical protein [Austropuccinia psidii MF-1]
MGSPCDAKPMYATPFSPVIGWLAYLVRGSRPDLAVVFSYLARHSMGPTFEHWELLDHIVGYLLKTCDQGIQLRLGGISLNLWGDAGWGGNLECSQMGFILKLGDTPILWASKQQSIVALSTCTSNTSHCLTQLNTWYRQLIN